MKLVVAFVQLFENTVPRLQSLATSKPCATSWSKERTVTLSITTARLPSTLPLKVGDSEAVHDLRGELEREGKRRSVTDRHGETTY